MWCGGSLVSSALLYPCHLATYRSGDPRQRVERLCRRRKCCHSFLAVLRLARPNRAPYFWIIASCRLGGGRNGALKWGSGWSGGWKLCFSTRSVESIGYYCLRRSPYKFLVSGVIVCYTLQGRNFPQPIEIGRSI